MLSQYRRRHGLVLLVVGMVGLKLIPATAGIAALSNSDIELYCQLDQQRVEQWRRGLEQVMDFIRSRNDLFEHGRSAGELTARQQREIIVTWTCFMDYFLALDARGRFHNNFSAIRDRELRQQSFQVGYALFLVQYRFVMELLYLVDAQPELTALFNQSLPELGLPPLIYSRLKARFLDPARKQEFAALNAILHSTSSGDNGGAAILTIIRDDASRVWNMTDSAAKLLSSKDAQKYVRDNGISQWWPLPVDQGRWGDPQTTPGAISDSQLQQCLRILQPGDLVFMHRRNSLGQTGIAGFWQHVAIYIGTAAQRAAFFANDQDLQKWLQQSHEHTGSFNDLLSRKYPQAMQHNAGVAESEAAAAATLLFVPSSGVTLLSAATLLRADSLVILRPRLSRLEIATALLRALQYYGRAYDPYYDFMTDTALTSSEIVVRAYQPQSDGSGLSLPRRQVIGRLVCSPNDILAHVEATIGTEQQQLDLLLFLDGFTNPMVAEIADKQQFRSSCQRPKWQLHFELPIAEPNG